MTIRTGFLQAMVNPKKSLYKNHRSDHLIIDEYTLQTKDKKAVEEEIQETNTHIEVDIECSIQCNNF